MRYVSLENLENGMVVAQDIKDIYERMLLAKGSVLSHSTIKKLSAFKLSGVYIEDEWSADIFIEPVVDEVLANKALRSLEKFDLDQIQDCAYTIVDKMLDSGDCFNDIETLKEYDENTFQHSLNVAISAVTMGIGLGYNFYRLRNLAVGAMLHDIGKKNVPIEIITKNGKLTDEEYAIIKKHPKYGYDILSEDILTFASTKQIVHQHHENWDGTGYPRRLKGDDIYELAMVVHVCDVFDALVSKRSYKDAFSYKKAIEIMQEGRGSMYNPEVFDKFFEVVPVYHKGTFVRLSDGNEALIYKNNKGDMLNPVVKLKDGTHVDLRESPLTIIS